MNENPTLVDPLASGPQPGDGAETENPRPTPPPPPAYAYAPQRPPLRRSRTDRVFGGVCGGIGQITGMATWVWRLVFALLVLCGGTGVLFYLLLWIFVPLEDPGLHGTPGELHAG